MVSTIIVFTGPFRGRRLIAEKMARWLEAPCLFMESILEGLQPCNTGNSTLVSKENMFEELLQSVSPVSRQGNHPLNHAYGEEVKNLAQTALRLVLCQLPHLARAMNNVHSCIVLELSWCSTEIVEMFMTMLDHHPNKSVFDRGLIIECLTRGEASTGTDKWRQFEEDKIYPGTFSGGHDSTNYRADLEKAIEQQLYLLSSKFEQVKMLHCGQLKDRFVSTLKMDPSLDFDYLGDPPRLRSERHTVPSNFHHAIRYLAFSYNIDISACFNISMREWAELSRKIISKREMAVGCFTGQSPHTLCTSNDQSFIDDDRCCRLCGEEVLITQNESFYYYCCYCPLNLHKACAEGLDDSSVNPPSPAALDAKDELMSLMKQEDKARTMACPSCKTKGKGFQRKCVACVFDTFLNCRSLPTVVPSPFGNQQSDFFVTRTLICRSLGGGPCGACGEPILTKAGIYYGHSALGLRYGFTCVALLPRETLHTHFGYRHLVKLMDKPHQDLDSYICDVCWQERDPVYWYYYCKECDFTAHVYLVYGVNHMEKNSLVV